MIQPKELLEWEFILYEECLASGVQVYDPQENNKIWWPSNIKSSILFFIYIKFLYWHYSYKVTS